MADLELVVELVVAFATTPTQCAALSSVCRSARGASWGAFFEEASDWDLAPCEVPVLTARRAVWLLSQITGAMGACAYFAEVVSAAIRCVHTPLTKSEAYPESCSSPGFHAVSSVRRDLRTW